MSVTKREQLLGEPCSNLMTAIEEVRAPIKARRLDSGEWKAEHLRELSEFDKLLDEVYWKAC